MAKIMLFSLIIRDFHLISGTEMVLAANNEGLLYIFLLLEKNTFLRTAIFTSQLLYIGKTLYIP